MAGRSRAYSSVESDQGHDATLRHSAHGSGRSTSFSDILEASHGSQQHSSMANNETAGALDVESNVDEQVRMMRAQVARMRTLIYEQHRKVAPHTTREPPLDTDGSTTTATNIPTQVKRAGSRFKMSPTTSAPSDDGSRGGSDTKAATRGITILPRKGDTNSANSGTSANSGNSNSNSNGTVGRNKTLQGRPTTLTLLDEIDEQSQLLEDHANGIDISGSRAHHAQIQELTSENLLLGKVVGEYELAMDLMISKVRDQLVSAEMDKMAAVNTLEGKLKETEGIAVDLRKQNTVLQIELGKAIEIIKAALATPDESEYELVKLREENATLRKILNTNP